MGITSNGLQTDSANFTLDGDSEEDSRDECSGDSTDVKQCSDKCTVYEDGVSEVSSPAIGEAKGADSTSNSVLQLEDTVDTDWTDDKHSSYLNLIEESFVKQMYENEYCALDLCGQAPKQRESSDPDSAESRPNFPSPFNEFKVLRKGHWQKLNFARTRHLEETVAAAPAVLTSPWIQYFIPTTNSRGWKVPSRTFDESYSDHGVAALGVEEISAVETKCSDHKRTVHEACTNAEQQLSVWHHRLQHNLSGSNSLFCKREPRNTGKILFPPASITDKVDQDIQGETNVGRSHMNRLMKKQKSKAEDGYCSSRDQVVPLLISPNHEDAAKCIPYLKQCYSTMAIEQQCNDIPASLPAENIARTSPPKEEQKTGNDVDSSRQNNSVQ